MNYELASKLLATKKDLKNVKVFLEECSEAYYNQDSIIISDKQYDELYRKYKEITGDEIIGADAPKGTRTVSVEHDYQNLVGTLDKAQTYDEIKQATIANYYINRETKLTKVKEYQTANR